MSEIETEQVDFSELVVGDVVFSDGRKRQGVITELRPEFGQVTLDTGAKPNLTSPVTIRKRN